VPKLPRISGDACIAALERLGYVALRQRGSHVVMKKVTPTGALGCTVPRHKELAIGTLHGILRQAQVTTDDLLRNL
jgi:predicted RNA binding protein YcfA (HicA-like mRNA interferase family)